MCANGALVIAFYFERTVPLAFLSLGNAGTKETNEKERLKRMHTMTDKHSFDIPP